MYSRFYGPKLVVVIYFLVFLCTESLHAQRLTLRLHQYKNSSRQSIFHRLFSPLRNLVQEITSRQNADFNASLFPPETFLSTSEIIRFHGYPVEEHKVITSDGYIITIFRIIHTKNHVEPKDQKKREPVLIQHGLICSSDDFLLLNPKDILPYFLADSGHNVWLGNVRGNNYGKQHVNNISTNDPEFYDFPMDDLARDLPQIIKYILKVENVPQLSYVCHSMGCTLISMAVSETPGLNDLVKKGSFLAPGGYSTYVNSRAALALLNLPVPLVEVFSQRFARGPLLPLNLSLAMRKYVPGICLIENLCSGALSYLSGLNPGQITNGTLVKVFAHFPADTSMKVFFQTYQATRSGNFQKYDYGFEKNLELYGTAQPPLYNFSRVVFPIQGFYSLGDIVTPPKDILRVWSELGNVVETIQIEDEKWAHLDFIYGKDARKWVYEKVVQFLSS